MTLAQIGNEPEETLINQRSKTSEADAGGWLSPLLYESDIILLLLYYVPPNTTDLATMAVVSEIIRVISSVGRARCF